MVQFVYSPAWFYNIDIVIDLVSVFVIALLAFFSFRYSRFDRRNRRYLYFAVSFAFLAFSFLARILTNFTIYNDAVHMERVGNILIAYHQVVSSNLPFFSGFFMYRLLSLLGLFLLFSVYERRQSASVGFLVIYLILVSAFFSSSVYYVFHITALVLLMLIILQLVSRYCSGRNALTAWLAASFSVIALSNLLFVFVAFNSVFYVAAESVQLFGYFILLCMFVRVLLRGKKGPS